LPAPTRFGISFFQLVSEYIKSVESASKPYLHKIIYPCTAPGSWPFFFACSKVFFHTGGFKMRNRRPYARYFILMAIAIGGEAAPTLSTTIQTEIGDDAVQVICPFMMFVVARFIPDVQR